MMPLGPLITTVLEPPALSAEVEDDGVGLGSRGTDLVAKGSEFVGVFGLRHGRVCLCRMLPMGRRIRSRRCSVALGVRSRRCSVRCGFLGFRCGFTGGGVEDVLSKFEPSRQISP